MNNQDPLFAAHIRIVINRYYKPSYKLTSSGECIITLIDEEVIRKDNKVSMDKDNKEVYEPFFIPLIIQHSKDFGFLLNQTIQNTLKLEIRDDKTFQEAFRQVEQYYRFKGITKGSILSKFSKYCTDTIERQDYPAQTVIARQKALLEKIKLQQSLEEVHKLIDKGLEELK